MIDSGVYVCNASNKFGSDLRNGTLNVTRKTQIQMRTGNQEVRRGASVLLRCAATTDPAVTAEVQWYKDKQLLVYTGSLPSFERWTTLSVHFPCRSFDQGLVGSTHLEDHRCAVR